MGKIIFTAFLLLFSYQIEAQIKVLHSDETYLIGEVYKDVIKPRFAASLSYSVTSNGNLYSLKYRRSSGESGAIDFYASPVEVNNLYTTILNDFSKLPGEFETIIALGEREIKINFDFLEVEFAGYHGRSSSTLEISMDNQTLFTLNKEELKKLFGK